MESFTFARPFCERSAQETESLYHQLLLSNLEFKWWIEKELAESK